MRKRNISLVLGFAILVVLGADVNGRAAPAGSNTSGFIYNYNSRQFSSLSAPPFPFAINDSGDIVGVDAHVPACLRVSGGQITTIVPEQGVQKCSPVGINGAGTVIGWYLTASSAHRAFVAIGPNITEITYPGCFSMDPAAINNAGEITGSCSYAGQVTVSSSAFIREANGQTTLFNVPGATGTGGVGIDGAGDVVGIARFPGGNSSAFFYSHGSIRTLVIAACETAEVRAMSNQGRIVGNCRQQGSTISTGFLMDSPSSPAAVFSGPNGEAILVTGVNDAGQVVGTMEN